MYRTLTRQLQNSNAKQMFWWVTRALGSVGAVGGGQQQFGCYNNIIIYITRRVQASGPSPHGASTVSYGFFICRFGPRGPTLSKHKIGQVRIYAYINMSQLRVVCQYEFFISVDVVWMPLLSPHVVVELLRIRSWEVGRCGAWQSFVVRTRECSLSHARPAAYVAERPCCSTTPRDTPQHGPRDTHPPRTETLYCKLLFYSK